MVSMEEALKRMEERAKKRKITKSGVGSSALAPSPIALEKGKAPESSARELSHVSCSFHPKHQFARSQEVC